MDNENIIIRPVKIEDSAAIACIYNEYVSATTVSFEIDEVTSEDMQKRILDISSSYPYYVCEADGVVIGYCYAHPWKERAAYRYTHETTVYIHPQYHGKGIGHRLMRRLTEGCRDMGCHALIACITSDNTASIAFHASLGFERVSYFKSVGFKFGKWLDVVDMELVLADKDS